MEILNGKRGTLLNADDIKNIIELWKSNVPEYDILNKYHISQERLYDITDYYYMHSPAPETDKKYKVVYPVHTGSSSMHYRTEVVDYSRFITLLKKYGNRLEIITR